MQLQSGSKVELYCPASFSVKILVFIFSRALHLLERHQQLNVFSFIKRGAESCFCLSVYNRLFYELLNWCFAF